MKTLIFVITYFIIGVSVLPAQTKRALIVGIGVYPCNSGWSIIHGDNDIKIVRESLSHLGYHNDNISILVNEEATKNNIVSKLKHLISVVNEGDIVYIHFSGHGQRVTDINRDEKDGFDESIIPYDACKHYKNGEYIGENHIVDDELNLYLSLISKKIGDSNKLYVIIDACHSGGSTRSYAESNIYKRGSSNIFTIPSDYNMPMTNISPVAIDWIEINACKSYQTNYECCVENKYFGSLSYTMYEIITNSTQGKCDIPEELLREELNKLHHVSIIQTPSILSPTTINTISLL